MISELIKLADFLDSKGLQVEADYLDVIIKKISHSLERDESDCEQDLGDELYYFKNLSETLENTEQENEARDMVDT